MFFAALSAGITLAANADPFELKTHSMDVRGVRDIENGDYERGIARLQSQLGPRPRVPSVEVPILIDLCAGYVMANELEKATRVCDRAANSKWYTGLAYNNRGVLNIAKGRYETAIRDFEMALQTGGPRTVVERNLTRAQNRVAAIRRQQESGQLAAEAAPSVRSVDAIVLARDEKEAE
jgi:Flp pilus assembly protein TadD